MQSHITHEIGIRVHLNVGTFIISRNGILCTMTSEVFERPSHSTSPKKAVAQFKFDSSHDKSSPCLYPPTTSRG